MPLHGATADHMHSICVAAVTLSLGYFARILEGTAFKIRAFLFSEQRQMSMPKQVSSYTRLPSPNLSGSYTSEQRIIATLVNH